MRIPIEIEPNTQPIFYFIQFLIWFSPTIIISIIYGLFIPPDWFGYIAGILLLFTFLPALSWLYHFIKALIKKYVLKR